MKLFLYIFIFIFITVKSQVNKNFTIPKNPKIGLSLAGGGAKGFAHIGVLKLIDSLGIRIDYISGTSMGAIVGGLYASGYSANEIEKIVEETDFTNIFSNEKNRKENSFFRKNNDKYLLQVPINKGKINLVPKSITDGQKHLFLLKQLFEKVEHIEDFSKLPIPFLCVATNLETGKEKIFDQGNLVNCIYASAALPTLVDPVEINDSLYIDGAIALNYPSKPLKDKGIDIVIGVDLSQDLSNRKQLNSALGILNQLIDIGIQKETKNQYNYTDINIKPNFGNKHALSYDSKSELIQMGFDKAIEYLNILNLLPKKNVKTNTLQKIILSNVYKLDSLSIENNHIFNKDYIQGKMGLKLPSIHTHGSIQKMMDKLFSSQNYSNLSYEIIQKNNTQFLKIIVNENNTKSYLNIGLHYDNVFKSGLLINTTIKRLFFRNAILSMDAILGDSPRYYINYFVDNGFIPGFGVYLSGMELEFQDNLSNVYETRRWFRNEIYIQSIYKDKYAIGGGLSHDFFSSKNNSGLFLNPKNFINPYAFIKSDTQDDSDFPTRGFYMNMEGRFLDFFNQKNENLQVKAQILFHFPISKRLNYTLELIGGITLGKLENNYYKYNFGGIFGQNLGNLLVFPGLQFGQISTENIFSTVNKIQVRISKNYFISTHFAMANHFNQSELVKYFNINLSSVGINIGYKSPFGQIKLDYSKIINNSQKGVFNIVLGHWF